MADLSDPALDVDVAKLASRYFIVTSDYALDPDAPSAPNVSSDRWRDALAFLNAQHDAAQREDLARIEASKARARALESASRASDATLPLLDDAAIARIFDAL